MANQRMTKEHKDDPSIIIPKGFEDFLNNPHYEEFLEALLDYCRELFRLEQKQKSLELEAR
jgi:hypothetical protein